MKLNIIRMLDVCYSTWQRNASTYLRRLLKSFNRWACMVWTLTWMCGIFSIRVELLNFFVGSRFFILEGGDGSGL